MISFDFSSVATWPRLIPCSEAQAPTGVEYTTRQLGQGTGTPGLAIRPGYRRAALVGGRFHDLREKLTKCPASIRVGAAIRYPDPETGRKSDEESGDGSRGLRMYLFILKTAYPLLLQNIEG